MLVLTRKIGEKTHIGGDITVVVTKTAGNRVTLGIEAPEAVRIVRGELVRCFALDGGVLNEQSHSMSRLQ